MKKIGFLFFLLWPLCDAFSYSYVNSLGAGFRSSLVGVRVTSLSEECVHAGVTAQQLVRLVNPAIEQFWNRVTTSRLRLHNAGILQTSDQDYIDGKLCSAQLDDDCEQDYIPMVHEIVITCNQNQDNFASRNVYAVTLNNHLTTQHIVGSVIIINDTPDSTFGNLSEDQIIAVLAHEIGHAIGLGHTQNRANLMYFSLVPKRVGLGQDDINGVSSLYPHRLDTCGAFRVQDHKDDGNGPGFLSLFFFSFLISLASFFFLRMPLSRLRKDGVPD